MASFPVTQQKYVKRGINPKRTYPESLEFSGSKEAWGIVIEFGGWIQSGDDLTKPYKGLSFVVPNDDMAALFKLKYR